MKMFIIESAWKVSDHYHDGGGLAIIAESYEKAEKMVEESESIEVTKEEWENAFVYELKYGEEPRIFVFPDAGCC